MQLLLTAKGCLSSTNLFTFTFIEDLNGLQRPGCFARIQQLALHSFQNNSLHDIHKNKKKKQMMAKAAGLCTPCNGVGL